MKQKTPGIYLCLLVLGLLPYASALLAGESPPGKNVAIYDTEKAEEPLLSPEEARQSFEVPDGFTVSLFAAEPELRQPIAMAFDGRGRLWVVENYTYAEVPLRWDARLRDRILVFEDTDGDGRADERKVFWDQGQKLTSVEVGFGGVWALGSPELLFFPDRDGDDQPDGEPEVLLDGWDGGHVRHNIVNGLRWGPDGWLYGRHGILATSFVGPPGTPRDKRTPINSGIWRYHPVRRQFEVVTHGTTNPWGHDWDERGELFFINTVIGHLWHAIPGSHVQRMYGEDLNPHVYELLPQVADHVHWGSGEKWHDVRELGVTEASSNAGGGHAHSGLMIYQGDRWPEAYRGDVFTLNLFGRRVNRDRLERQGAGFVGRHRPDLFKVGDRRFRGLDLLTGPEGDVWVSDWSDAGECHDNDGVHRNSGRIYRIGYGELPRRSSRDVDSLPDAELVRLQLHRNDWWVRQARRVLQERAANGADMRATHEALRLLFREQEDVTRKLRAMWCLQVTGGADVKWLEANLRRPEESVRVQAVRLLVDHGAPVDLPPGVLAAFTTLAREDSSGLVLAHLASALQRLLPEARWPLAEALAVRIEFAGDPAFPLLLWYGVEAAVPAHVSEAVALAEKSGLSQVRRLIARRLAEDLEDRTDGVELLLTLLASPWPEPFQVDILRGLNDGLRGWQSAKEPEAWKTVSSSLLASSNPEIREYARTLAVVFGDGRAIEDLRRVVEDRQNETGSARRRALRTLIGSRADGLAALLTALVRDRSVAVEAIRGLGLLGEPSAPKVLLDRWPKFRAPSRAAVVDVLSARPAFARELLRAVSDGRVSRRDIPVFQVRRMRYMDDAEVKRHLDALWPELQLPAQKEALAEKYRKSFTPQQLRAADTARGKALFVATCAPCHKLLGEGGEAGPDLTSMNRADPGYLIMNLVDPNAEVAESYRASVITLHDGTVLSGVVGAGTRRTLSVRTPTEKLTIERKTIRSIQGTTTSIMPEGLLEALKEDERRDLIAYLMGAR